MNTLCHTTVDVCSDCIFPIIYGDFSAIDFHFSGDEATARINEIELGITNLTNSIGVLSAGDSHDEMSSEACACCGTSDAGDRYEVVGTETIIK